MDLSNAGFLTRQIDEWFATDAKMSDSVDEMDALLELFKNNMGDRVLEVEINTERPYESLSDIRSLIIKFFLLGFGIFAEHSREALYASTPESISELIDFYALASATAVVLAYEPEKEPETVEAILNTSVRFALAGKRMRERLEKKG